MVDTLIPPMDMPSSEPVELETLAKEPKADTVAEPRTSGTAPNPLIAPKRGVFIVGRIVSRWKKDFKTFCKVWYEVATDRGSEQFAQVMSTFDVEATLPVGTEGFFEVYVDVYKDKNGEPRWQYTMAGSHSGMKGEKF